MTSKKRRTLAQVADDVAQRLGRIAPRVMRLLDRPSYHIHNNGKCGEVTIFLAAYYRPGHEPRLAKAYRAVSLDIYFLRTLDGDDEALESFLLNTLIEEVGQLVRFAAENDPPPAG